MNVKLLWIASLLIPLHLAAQEPEAEPDVAPVTDSSLKILKVLPSDSDPEIRRFNEPNIVLRDPAAGASAQLVVFLPGTKGKPLNAMTLLRVVAHQGYRAIGLSYDDEPAVVQTCPRRPPACSGNFRHARIYGGEGVESTPPAESIVNRLVKLLGYLDQHDPNAGWNSFIANGEPNWERIVVSGLSQGAGMAAYIAKEKRVARVVLFSSPWDYTARKDSLAPWISAPSVTPPERWFAEYHQRENTAHEIAAAYRLLGIPSGHVQIFNLDLAPDARRGGQNPFHSSTIRNPGYEPQWRELFGRSP